MYRNGDNLSRNFLIAFLGLSLFCSTNALQAQVSTTMEEDVPRSASGVEGVTGFLQSNVLYLSIPAMAAAPLGIEIRNRTGQLVFSSRSLGSAMVLPQLAQGSYQVRVYGPNGSSVFTIEVKK